MRTLHNCRGFIEQKDETRQDSDENKDICFFGQELEKPDGFLQAEQPFCSTSDKPAPLGKEIRDR